MILSEGVRSTARQLQRPADRCPGQGVAASYSLRLQISTHRPRRSPSGSGRFMVPTRIRPDADRRLLLIDWPNGPTCELPLRPLRAACRCALCVDEFTGERLIYEDGIPPDIAVQSLRLVGNYALRIHWSDGHSTGLFTWERLAELCRCLNRGEA
jgi:DUF971 family protein